MKEKARHSSWFENVEKKVLEIDSNVKSYERLLQTVDLKYFFCIFPTACNLQYKNSWKEVFQV